MLLTLTNTFLGVCVLEETEASRRQAYALTANGDKLFNRGSFMVNGSCNGVRVSLNFTNMKVDIPVASVRTLVRSGNEVDFFEGGGVVRNRESGVELPIVEMSGVYFLKLKLKDPAVESPNKSPFGRPGP